METFMCLQHQLQIMVCLLLQEQQALSWGNPTVADKAITLAKLADVATGTVFYRKLQD
jgi:hypothetical protein